MTSFEDVQRNYGAAFDVIVKAATSTTTDAVRALEAFAAGKDGVLGTPDDTIDPNTLVILSDLIDSGLAHKIVDLARAKTPTSSRGLSSCFASLFSCFGR